jgi:hypothetical protein
MRESILAVLFAGAFGCSPEAHDARRSAMTDTMRQAAAPPIPAAVDHVLLAVSDLQAGMKQFEDLTGVRAQIGGQHPGRGTQNALVSLGGATYLEIIAPNPADSAGPRMVGEFAPFATLTPYGWAVRSEDMDALADSLGARQVPHGAIRPGARVRPDGARLEWRTLTVEEPASPFIPFFIQWGAFSAHPATTSPMGCTLRELRFEAPDPDELRDRFARLDIVASVTGGPEPAMRVRLDCPSGAVDFPSPRG